MNLIHTSLKSMFIEERPSGSKPTSPGIVPSSFSGWGMKGIDLLLAIMHTDDLEGVLVYLVIGVGFKNADALAARVATEKAIVIFMVLREL